MIVSSLGAAYAPQPSYSLANLSYAVPSAPVLPQLVTQVPQPISMIQPTHTIQPAQDIPSAAEFTLMPAPALPAMPEGPGDAYARQPAPVMPPITTPESADVMNPTPTYTLPNYDYARPVPAPNPQYSPTRYEPQVDYYPGYGPGSSSTPTATQPTVEFPDGMTPGSMEASLEAQSQAAAATPWYMDKTYWLIGGAVAVGILLLRK